MDQLNFQMKNQNIKVILLKGDTLYLTVSSIRHEVSCPFCGVTDNKVHSIYKKSFQNLPTQDKKIVIILMNKEFFCENFSCSHRTFAERFDFIKDKQKKTIRLEKTIRDMVLNCSTITASNLLKQNVVQVSRTTISNLLKKKRNHYR